MKSFVVLCILAVVCLALGAPEVENQVVLSRSRRDLDFLGNTRRLIKELAQNLCNSAKDALNSVETFKVGIRDEVGQVKAKIQQDIAKFRLRVTGAIDNVMEKISNTSAAVKNCVTSHRSAAAAVFNETLSGTLACVDERIAEVTELIDNLVTIANDAMASGSQALDDMKKCTTDTTNLLYAGTCLGRIALNIEMKSVGFIRQCAVTIGRINIGVAMLPATLEVCAGKRLIQTGIATGKIVLNVGTCSTVEVFNSIIGKPSGQ